jgi:hypothetical protein
MPRFFFHISDGAEYRDHEGIELIDIAAARRQAIETAGGMLKEFWSGPEWRMTVVDALGKTVCLLRFYAE